MNIRLYIANNEKDLSKPDVRCNSHPVYFLMIVDSKSLTAVDQIQMSLSYQL